MSDLHYKRNLKGALIDRRNYDTAPKSLSEVHVHDAYELLYILNGDIAHVIEGRRYKLNKHDLVIVRPNQYHFLQINAPNGYERYDIVFDPKELGVDNIDLLLSQMDVIKCKHLPIITECFKKLDYYNSVMDDEMLAKTLGLIIKEIIFNVSLIKSASDNVEMENLNPMVIAALDYINENLLTISSVSEIAKELFVTESYLYRIFKSELMTTPLKYITEKRLNIAKSLIMQGVQPTKACAQAGFNDYSTFYRGYKKHFGYSPMQKSDKNI